MTNLEIALSCLSVVETIVTILLHRRMKKKLDAERILYETKRIEYERLVEALPIQRNLL
jgi:hypothetical protein